MEAQVSTAEADWQIDALTPNGTVVYHGNGVLGRFVGSAGSVQSDIKQNYGSVVWRDGMLQLLVGRSVYQIQP